jgi:hypothetical protein
MVLLAEGSHTRLQWAGREMMKVHLSRLYRRIADFPTGASFDIVGCVSPQPDRSNQNNAGAAHRIDDAGEFRECPVAGSLDDAAPAPRSSGHQFAAVRLEAVERTFLVRAHEARIAAASRRARIILYWFAT